MLQIPRALILLTIAAIFVGCGAGSPDSEPGGPAPATYTTRGRVLTMPAAPGEEIQLEHEAIDDFVDFRGEVVGMDAMTMSFAIAEGAAGEIVAGDIVEFDLYVDWNAEPLATVTRLEKLPADTELVFGRAEPTDP